MVHETKAIILAAGFGTRMKEYTKNLPKPMLPLNGRPMIEYTVRQLVSYGITDIAINLHYLGDKIKNHLGDGSKFGAQITYLDEDAPSGTAGGVKKLAPFCEDAKNILVIYGDIITDLDYNKFIQAHVQNAGLATICVHQRAKSNSIIEFDSTMLITNFIERPDELTLQRYSNSREIWVNSAIYCFKPKILDLIKPDIVQDFPKDIFPQILAQNQLFAYKLEAKRYAIDSEDKYLEADKNIKNFKFSF